MKNREEGVLKDVSKAHNSNIINLKRSFYSDNPMFFEGKH